MKLVLSHPTGNSFVRAAANGFKQAGMLAEFHTCIASFSGDVSNQIGALPMLSDIRRRHFDLKLKPVTHAWPYLEVGRLISAKIGLAKLARHEKGLFSVDAVYRNLDKRVASSLKKAALQGVEGVYAYEDGAEFSFRQGKSLGMKCLYDLPIGYWRTARKFMDIERERWPDWASTLTGLEDSDEKLARKDEELRLADKIFVASKFTATTLEDFPGHLAPIEIIPYAFPQVSQMRNYFNISTTGPIKLLFIGGLSQRKGIANLFSVVSTFRKHVELTIVGYKASEKCAVLNEELAKHRWIPSLSHKEILKLMQEHDVLVFPSLFEGFGLVITEAMSQGMPVITTDRTAGPDLIKHQENGWLTKAGCNEELIQILEEIIRQPELIAEVGYAAQCTAKKRPWEFYERELIKAIEIIDQL